MSYPRPNPSQPRFWGASEERRKLSNIIDLKDRFPAAQSVGGGLEHEAFLVTEGLDLLASYRSIKDAAIRAKVRAVVAALANDVEIAACLKLLLPDPADL